MSRSPRGGELPGWPRLLSRDLAAAYLGVSPPSLDAHLPVSPRRVGRRVLWDRHDIDRWLDGQAADRPMRAWIDRL